MTFIRFFQVILAIGAIGILVVVHEFGHFITSKLFNIKVLEFMLGLPGPKLFSFKYGETTYGITTIPFGGYVKTVGSDPYEELTEEEKKRSLEHAPFIKKSIVVLAGPFMNFLFAILLMFLIFKFIGMPTPVNTNQIGALYKNYPAYKAGIKAGDKILEIDGVPTKNWEGLYKEISKKPNQIVILKIKHKSSIKIIKLRTKSVKVKGRREGKIGISPVTKNQPSSILASAKESFLTSWWLISKTSIVVFNAVTGKPQVLLKQGRGVVGIVSEASAAITSVYVYLLLIAGLNIGIGFVNLLPIPPLDGGKIIVYVVELIKGRHLSKKTLISINTIGIALLLTLFVYFTIKDVTRIIQGIYLKI